MLNCKILLLYKDFVLKNNSQQIIESLEFHNLELLVDSKEHRI